MEQAWKDAFADFGLLFVASWGFSLAFFAWQVPGKGKPWTVIGLFGETICSAGVGASVGVYHLERLGPAKSIANAVLCCVGVIKREWIGNFIYAVFARIFGVGNANQPEPPGDPSRKPGQ